LTTLSQRSFSGGELAPALYARIDTVKYATGLHTCRNTILLRHGGTANRPGSVFIGEVKDSSKTVKLVPFIFNTSQTYVLEFGNLYFRIIKDGSYVSDLTLTITGITKANPAVLTYTGTDPADGDEFRISGVLGMTQVNGRNFKVVNVNTGANTFEMDLLDGTNLDSTSYGTYISGGTAERIYTVTTTYVEADLPALKYVQSADVMTMTHPSYVVREVARTGDAAWTITTVSFAPSISAPTGQTNNGGAGTTTAWKITAVKAETYEESLPSSSTSSSSVPTPSAIVTVDWNAVSGAVLYNIYRDDNANGIFGYVGSSTTSDYRDIGLTADYSDQPPTSKTVFASSNNYPSVAAYIQQRRFFASSNTEPEKVWASRIGAFNSFTINTPVQDDDAINFTISGNQVNRIVNLFNLNGPVIMTASGEWSINGDVSGAITPTEINVKQHSYNGSASNLVPLVIGTTAIYVQARGSAIRDIAYDWQSSGYRGNDLTIFAPHLFDGFEIEDWSFQQIPNYIVWAVRDDGKVVALTYIREHEIWGWHRHDFDNGEVENVTCIPEGAEDDVYFVIKRTINSKTVRYVEKLATRTIDLVEDCIFLDAALSYDGRNTGSTTMTISGGTNYTYDENLTITSSSGIFTALDVGNAIHLTGDDGTIIRFSLDAYTSSTVMTGHVDKTVPLAMRSATTDWSMAVDELQGLWHLEGEDVSIFADGFVIASPLNPKYETYTVTNGTITLTRPFSVIHVGLPITSDIETLDIDTNQAETLADKNKKIDGISVHVEKTRGFWAGAQPPTDDDADPLENLIPMKLRSFESYEDPIDLQTGIINGIIKSDWNDNGRLFLRNIDPVPMSVLAISISGEFPFRKLGST
jgi:hypothetical protein